MTWIPPAARAPGYSEWGTEPEGDWEYLGTVPQEDAPMLYNVETGFVHRALVDHERERLTPEDESTWELDPEETLGEFLERVGQDVGWESLSEFARDHLEDGDRR